MGENLPAWKARAQSFLHASEKDSRTQCFSAVNQILLLYFKLFYFKQEDFHAQKYVMLVLICGDRCLITRPLLTAATQWK